MMKRKRRQSKEDYKEVKDEDNHQKMKIIKEQDVKADRNQ